MTVTINSIGTQSYPVFQVYLVKWDVDVRIRFAATDKFVAEGVDLDFALEEVNSFLFPFEKDLLAESISEAIEEYCAIEGAGHTSKG